MKYGIHLLMGIVILSVISAFFVQPAAANSDHVCSTDGSACYYWSGSGYACTGSGCNPGIFKIVKVPSCGDLDLNGVINSNDINQMVNYVFRRGSLQQPGLVDMNNDNIPDVLDVVTLINYLIRNGPEPACIQKPTTYHYSSYSCGVDIDRLDATDNTVHLSIKNTGGTGQRIHYNLFIDGSLVKSDSFYLNAGDRNGLAYYYDFTPYYGYYSNAREIRAEAHSSCYSYDSEVFYYRPDNRDCNYPDGNHGDRTCDIYSGHYLICQDGRWVYTSEACANAYDYDYYDPYRPYQPYCNYPYYASQGEQYRCDGNWLQRGTYRTDCTVSWTNYIYCNNGCAYGSCSDTYAGADQRACYSGNLWWFDRYGNRLYVAQSCPNGCSSGQCIGYQSYPPYTSPSCGVSIEGFDYMTSVREGDSAFVKARMLNTGNRNQYVTVRLYADGVVKDTYSTWIDQGRTVERTFYYTPRSGSNEIRLVADTDCGSTDSDKAIVYGTPREQQNYICNNNYICETGENINNCPADCTPRVQPPSTTTIDINPISLATEVFKAKTIAIDITSSRAQRFEISIDGVPKEWLSYTTQVTLSPGEGEWYKETVYVYVVPTSTGRHFFDVSVLAAGENREFQSRIEMFVAPDEKVSADATGDFITGDVFTSPAAILWVTVIILILTLIVIVYIAVVKME